MFRAGWEWGECVIGMGTHRCRAAAELPYCSVPAENAESWVFSALQRVAVRHAERGGTHHRISVEPTYNTAARPALLSSVK